jgi:streptomycin 6-kinase
VADTGLTLDDWRRQLPDLLDRLVGEWELQLGQPFTGGMVGQATPALLPDGTAAVLKLVWPHHEARNEAEALELWNGDGAVKLLARNDDGTALLLERCDPGEPLSTLELEAALDVYVDLLPRLWKPAGAPFQSLAAEAAMWADALPREWEAAGRPFERGLVDAALRAIEELASTQGEQVLLHQDVHALNVLSAQREPWLAIDPKPLVGERDFTIAPIVRGSELGHGRREVFRRFDRLTAELGLDRERARGWCIAQTIAWGIAEPGHREAARWLLEAA